jgi:hypothetical protein
MKRWLIAGLLLGMAGTGAVTAPTASAECSSSGGVTICAQGNVSGPSGQPAPSSGPYWPYPCDEDWLCDDGGVSIVLNPDIGLPGRPGNRPR